MNPDRLQEHYDVCVPCRAACPIRTDVPGYLEAIAQGDMDKAQAINRRDNVFPGVLGRVCHRPCEPACRHGREGLGDPVQICFLKRAASDFGNETRMEMAPPIGKSICIIGSGPSGLTAANDLALAGCDVTVLEQYSLPGGMLQYGIPEFRLPRDIVEKDIQSILDLGVTLKTDVVIDSLEALKALQSDYDAVVIAGGCMRASILEEQQANFDAAVPGLEYMQAVNRGTQGRESGHVVVIGGGFTAVDCARSAIRLGAEKVSLVYRRTKEWLRVGPNEIEALDEEHVHTHFLYSPRDIILENGNIQSISFTPMNMNAAGELSESAETPLVLEAAKVIMAIGQDPDDLLEVKSLGDDDPSIYVTGDFRDGSGTVIQACAAGRQTAQTVLADLGHAPQPDTLTRVPVPKAEWQRTLEDLDIPIQPVPKQPLENRMNQQAEVERGFDVSTAKTEASRCYFCDYTFTIDAERCIYCMKCIDAMPVNCISLTRGPIQFSQGNVEFEAETNYNNADGIVIDYDACVRCGECVRVCPVDCISIERFSVQREQPNP